jgi:F420-dependent oxidoreductase-like protein
MILPQDKTRFGIHAGQQYSNFDNYLAIWKKAEELGFSWGSVMDHFVPIQADPTGPCFEGFSLLSSMAAHTTSMALGIIVSGITYRHPALIAKMATTIDHVSAGRMELGLGLAWYELEHNQYGIAFPTVKKRAEMLIEAIQIIKMLFTQETTTFEGKYYRLKDAYCEPKPYGENIPIWVGAMGEKLSLPIVGKFADGWNTFLMDFNDYKRKLEIVKNSASQNNRDPDAIRRAIVFNAVLGDTRNSANDNLVNRAEQLKLTVDELKNQVFCGTGEEFAERLKPFYDLGVRDFLLLSTPPADEQSLQVLSTVSSEFK